MAPSGLYARLCHAFLVLLSHVAVSDIAFLPVEFRVHSMTCLSVCLLVGLSVGNSRVVLEE